MHRLFSLVLLLLLAGASLQQDADVCNARSVAGFDDQYFYDSPQDVYLSACSDSSEHSCCSPEYSSRIAAALDPMSVAFASVIDGSLAPTCRSALQDFSCIMCSHEQVDFLYVFDSTHGYTQYTICDDLCTSVYNSCKSNSYIIVGTTQKPISQVYSTAESFCFALFAAMQPNITLSINHIDDECWDNMPECTADDFYYAYSDCIDGTRSLTWYKKPDADCNGGASAPAPQNGLPCAVSCPAGQVVLNVGGEIGCHNCAAGKYSLGGAIRIDTWPTTSSWASLQLPFTTYCTETISQIEYPVTDGSCAGWVLEGFQADSGDLGDNQSSYLETSVTLVEDGIMTVTYSVDCEQYYDGLTIIVDHLIAMSKKSSAPLFTTVNIPLNAGYHFIQFVYSKDSSVSRGVDMAFINYIQITNARYADYQCTRCPAGKFNNATGMDFCYNCPANTYAPNTGSQSCTPCPIGTYSYEGASQCTQADPCTTSDYTMIYGLCQYIEGVGLKRWYNATWNQPKICSELEFSLPDPVLVSCGQCDPGTYRNSTSDPWCYPCPEGYASIDTEGDIGACEICPAGKEAIKTTYIDLFETWPRLNYRGLTTNCTGPCGTPGWVCHDSYIDSGSGHGDYVNSGLYLTLTLEEPGSIKFKYTFSCSESCSLQFTTLPSNAGAIYHSGSTIRTFQLPAGENSFFWQFTKQDVSDSARDDNVRIEYIVVTHTTEGGAPACTDCAAGTYSPNPGASNCLDADPGFYVPSYGLSSESQCPEGMYTDQPASFQCQQCGENVDTTPDQTMCNVDCIETFGDDTFDLNPMSRGDSDMYGPIYDINNRIYYLNVCTPQHNNHSCFDGHNDPIETYACQVNANGVGQDLGDVFGYIPLRDQYPQGTLGVTLHYTHGDTCRNLTSNTYYNRQAYVDIVCSPSSGIGEPVPRYANGTVEQTKCVYEFTWESLYGCPVCTADNYYYIVTDCTANHRTIEYYWIQNAEGYKMCHDGVPLPTSIPIDCVNANIACPEGEYVNLTDPSTASNPQCRPADVGHYSIGGGSKFDDWNPLPNKFSQVGWSGNDDYIASGLGDTTLLYIDTWVTMGYLEVSYKVYDFGDSTSGLTIYYDGVKYGETITSTGAEYVSLRIDNIPAGGHSFLFSFEGGTATTSTYRERGARIDYIKAIGLTLAAEYQLPCPAGSFQPAMGQSGCLQCPANFACPTGSDLPVQCLDSQYSFPGSAQCSDRLPCTSDDFQIVYGPCVNGYATATYSLIQPAICLDTEGLDGTSGGPNSACSCPLGTYSANGACNTCPKGQFYSSQKSSCTAAAAGQAAILTTGYFNGPMSGTDFPSEFTTGCSGTCSSNGWVFQVSSASSGDNLANDCDSWLELQLNLVDPGSVSFDYEVLGSSSNGIEVFVNNKQMDVAYHPTSTSKRDGRVVSSTTTATLSLSAGANAIRWNYHQEKGKSGSINLQNIIVQGVGGATTVTVCPVGYYSSAASSSYCSPCSPGYANEQLGQSSCTQCDYDSIAEDYAAGYCTLCGTLTYANDNHTDCVSPCVFDIAGNYTIDLNPLSSHPGPFPLSVSGGIDGYNEIMLHLCNKNNFQLVCVDPFGDLISTYACAIDERGNGKDNGHLLNIETVTEDETSIVFHYTDGDRVGCTGNGRKMDVTLVCDPDDDSSGPDENEDSTGCHTKLTWSTAYACRICKDDDYEERTTECDGGEKTTSDIRVNRCYGPAVKNSKVESCSTPLVLSLYVIILIIAVFAVLLVAIVLIVVRYRKLHYKYLALVEDQEGQYEMKEVEENNVADEEDAAPPAPAEE